MERTLESTVLHMVKTRLVMDYPGQIDVCLGALSEEQLWWRPNEHANSVANLVIHLVGSNRFFMDHVIGGQPDVRDRAAEFTARGSQGKADLLQLWSESVAFTGRTLNAFDPSRLMDTTERTGKTTTFVQILLHVSHHNSVHMGQIVYIAKQLNPAAIDDIWMRMRSK